MGSEPIGAIEWALVAAIVLCVVLVAIATPAPDVALRTLGL